MQRFVFSILAVCLIVSTIPSFAQDNPPILGAVHPALSPDGKQIAISYHGGIWIYSPATGIMEQRTAGGPWDIEPSWSPDGKQIAFLRTSNFHGGRLVLIDAASGAEQDLPKRIVGEGRLHFSPDGERILGFLSEGRSSPQLRWIDLETGIATPLKIGPEDPSKMRRKRIKFALSPNGETIAYTVHRDEPDEQGGNRGPQSDLWACGADGSNPRKIVSWPARIYDLIFDGGDSILAVTDLGSVHNNIWKIPLQNSLETAEKITSNFTDDERPSLNSQGGVLVWSNNAAGATSIRQLFRSSGFSLNLIPTQRVFQNETGKLRLNLSDAKSGRAVVARISLKSKEHGFAFPADAIYRVNGSLGHYYGSGKSQIEAPAGDYELQVFRGPEYRPWRKSVRIEKAKELELTINLERWTNQSERSWWSGENHIHANYGYGEWYNTPATILRQCQGEDLNVCNAVIANSDGEAIFDREFFRGQVDPRSTDRHIMYWGQEFRATLWGHMTLSNLAQLVEPIMTGFQGTTNPWDVPTNSDIAQRVIEQERALVSYTHPAGNRLDLYDQPYSAKGMPVEAALGKVMLMDVMGHTYDGSLQLWYRLLNCGLKVYASAGTDCFLNRVRSLPPGWARTYVNLPEGLSYNKWTEGQRQGRSFITNGPMLTFRYEGNPAAGSSVTSEKPAGILFKAKAESQYPMDRVEFVFNGEVVKTLDLSDDKLSAEFDGQIQIPESGWLALRAHGPAHVDVIREPNAHTNPIWITIPEKSNSKGPE